MSIHLGGPKHYQESVAAGSIDDDYREWYSERLNKTFPLHKSIETPDHQVITSFLESIGYDHDTAERVSLRYYRSIRHYTNSDNWFFVRPTNLVDLIHQNLDKPKAFSYKLVAQTLFKEQEQIVRIALKSLGQSFPRTFLISDPKKRTRNTARNIRPLAKDTYFTLRNLLRPTSVEEEELLVVTISYYCRSTNYLLALAHGRHRVDLSGNLSDPPQQSERDFAAALLRSRGIKLEEAA